MNSNPLFSIYVAHNNHYPETLLVSDGTIVEGYNQTFILRQAHFSDRFIVDWNIRSLAEYAPFLHVGNESVIKIVSFEGITSDKGITVEDGGLLNLYAEGSVNMQNNKVKNGGSLLVKGSNLELGREFEVAKGGSFEFNISNDNF